jgi:hypothetical protein
VHTSFTSAGAGDTYPGYGTYTTVQLQTIAEQGSYTFAGNINSGTDGGSITGSGWATGIFAGSTDNGGYVEGGGQSYTSSDS